MWFLCSPFPLICFLPWCLGPAASFVEFKALLGRTVHESHHTFTPPPPPWGSSSDCERQLFYFSQFTTQNPGFWPMVALMCRFHAQKCWYTVWVFLLSFRCSAYYCFEGRDLRMSLTTPCFLESAKVFLMTTHATFYWSAAQVQWGPALENLMRDSKHTSWKPRN